MSEPTLASMWLVTEVSQQPPKGAVNTLEPKMFTLQQPLHLLSPHSRSWEPDWAAHSPVCAYSCVSMCVLCPPTRTCFRMGTPWVMGTVTVPCPLLQAGPLKEIPWQVKDS